LTQKREIKNPDDESVLYRRTTGTAQVQGRVKFPLQLRFGVVNGEKERNYEGDNQDECLHANNFVEVSNSSEKEFQCQFDAGPNLAEVEIPNGDAYGNPEECAHKFLLRCVAIFLW